MFTIVTDVQITRRKRVHLVLDARGDTQFAAARLADVLDWLRGNDQTAVIIHDSSEQSWSVALRHINRALLQVERENEEAKALTSPAAQAQPELPLEPKET